MENLTFDFTTVDAAGTQLRCTLTDEQMDIAVYDNNSNWIKVGLSVDQCRQLIRLIRLSIKQKDL